MYGVYTPCPYAGTPKVLLQNEIYDITTEYKPWIETNTATLNTVTQLYDEFTENLVSKIPGLTNHHTMPDI
jgi:predicted choloylglycine hydrolase